MKALLSRAQIREFDHHAITSCRVPGVILMENAGRNAVDVIELVAPGVRAAVVVCGAGNNGGDGFVVARLLGTRGWTVRVFLAAARDKISGDARLNLDALEGLTTQWGSSADPGEHSGESVERPVRGGWGERDGGDDRVDTAYGHGRVTPIESLASADDLVALDQALTTAPLVIDALFGTGLARPIEGTNASIVASINRANGKRISLDLPSGLDADTGEVLGTVVNADVTITFAHRKSGMVTPEGARRCGVIHVVDIGVPASLVAHTGRVAELLEPTDVAPWLTRRDAFSYKHAAGMVLVIGGSPGKTGAPRLVARGALRAGAGLCTIASWPECQAALDGGVLEVMTTSLSGSDTIEPSHGDGYDPLRRIDELLEPYGKGVVVIGPGLGLDDRARKVVEHVVLEHHGVIVVDADALTVFAGRAEALAKAKGKLILTPHAGEMAKLLGRPREELEHDRYTTVREAARRTGAVVVMKGAHSLIAGAEGVHASSSGNPALGTAGSGDTLAGIIAAMACHLEPHQAASAGVMLHGMAADRWQRETGSDRGLMASEVSDHLPYVLGFLLAQGLR